MKIDLFTPFSKGGLGVLSPSGGGAGGGFPLCKIPLNLPLQKGDFIESKFFMPTWHPTVHECFPRRRETRITIIKRSHFYNSNHRIVNSNVRLGIVKKGFSY